MYDMAGARQMPRKDAKGESSWRPRGFARDIGPDGFGEAKTDIMTDQGR